MISKEGITIGFADNFGEIYIYKYFQRGIEIVCAGCI
jgi:hypothetical protein